MHDLPADPGILLTTGFIALPLFMIAGFGLVLKSWRVFGIGLGWAVLTAAFGISGWLTDFSGTPPRAIFLLGPTLVLVGVIAFSRIGKTLMRLPVKLLVGFQAFRILVELLIHRAVVEKVAPPQLSWEGLNLDILTGVTALILIFLVDRVPRWLLYLWNTMGLILVGWVVIVAILSMPTAFQRFHPDNVWVAFFPFVWLPAILVAFALLGHIVLFRKLISHESIE